METVSELKGKAIKFDDNTNDLVDIVVGAFGIFQTLGLFLKRKKWSKIQKAVAVRAILKSKSGLRIDDEKISLMMEKTVTLWFILNKKKNLILCIIRKKYDPDNIKSLIKQVVSQNSDLESFYWRCKIVAFIFYLKFFSLQIVKCFILEMPLMVFCQL